MQTLQRTVVLLLWLSIPSIVWGGLTLDDPAHAPLMPRPGQAVRITAHATPEIASLTLEYQIVDPGRYVELESTAFEKNWKSEPLVPGESTSAGATFQVELPGELQAHRRLVRYRFRGLEKGGRVFTSPAPDAARRNFAYFVYGGVPSWTGAIHPRGRDPQLRRPVAFDASVMGRVQSYHLLGSRETIENVTWNEQARDNAYRHTGTLVVDGVVYDHTRLRARGGVWRYAMGKNMWKFDLPQGQPLRARDDYGRPYPVPWGKVNLRACIQQGDYGHRGEQGMFESVGFRLFNLAGVPAPFTHWIQLRIITEANEAPADQYQGDYWGLYLAFEDVDDRFLKAHDLPDGNVYEMERGGGRLRSQAQESVADGSDLAAFLGAYQRSNRPEAWWRAHLDLSSYYSYRALCECIHHYDIGDGKNYFYYFNPRAARWQVIPWDIDLTWADNMYGSGDEPFHRRVLGKPAFRLEYQNRLREIRDLLFNPDETDRLIDECAALIADPGGGPSVVDADRAKWDYHPIMAEVGGKAGQGRFYRIAPSRDFKGMVQLMKSYVRRRGAWIDRTLLGDAGTPTPAITYQGPPGYPCDRLGFRAAESPGQSDFGAMQWRLAEVAPMVLHAGWPVAPGKYEITPVWQSDELSGYRPDVSLPSEGIIPGRTYRVRLRVGDRKGTWSHWSAPIQFVAGAREL